MPYHPPSAGFFGKIPSQADFVRDGLCEATVAALDLWCRESLLSVARTLGPDWRDAWMVAPVWHFMLPVGACGPQALLGVWMPSMDRVGRCYPFIACAHAPGPAALLDGAVWLDRVGEAAIRCVVEDAPTATLRRVLDEPATPRHVADTPGWWTDGGPRHSPARLALACLPPAAMAAGMVRDNESSCIPTDYVPTEVR
ncbi:type VI secretion system-associated protein TagF [Acetobacter sp. TBRC 12305]|uniref:Type VI secretion system-associated protein TagF n=1 Tax=Acetobacter garciniae TaxID=2817435 RepID=A0A939KRY9_9PROT|nr:type VI secretion system-associated protein TagF [Acetobacter garciniae]MBO1326501.1 type VI secretion system-associated protein TagF [Acetobacter garciniae]MBX0346183.1 type VI secretion system-associated protein TagF [Acetobacter garciniae]